jgi:hypothetical protein
MIVMVDEKPRRGRTRTKVVDSRRDRRFGGRITDELWERLVKVAAKDQRSVSAEIQIALTEWLDWKESKEAGRAALAQGEGGKDG